MSDDHTGNVYVPKRDFMQAAIDDVMLHLDRLEGGPFGACIVHRGNILALAHNSVLKDGDATCHAEVNAIRMASRMLRSYDLADCVIYSTTEPCPMCFSAIHWARIPVIVYGTRIDDVQQLGFNELSISNRQMRDLGASQVSLHGDFMRTECLSVLHTWRKLPGAVPY